MMLGSYWVPLLGGMAVGSVFTGCTMYLFGFRRVQAGERTLLVPELNRRPLRDRWTEFRHQLRRSEVTRTLFLALVSMMASVALLGFAQLTVFSYEQRARNAHFEQCNAEFQSTSIELRRIGNEDRALEAQDDELRNERDDAMTVLVESLVTPPPAGAHLDALSLLNQYRASTEAIDVKRDQLTAQRAQLEQQRRAQPAPKARC